MAYFPRLYELAVATNSRRLFEGMLVYCDRENVRDLKFANGLDNLWVEFLEHTNERQLFITELEGSYLSAKRYKILKCLNEDQKQDLIQLLEIRKELEAAGNLKILTVAMSVYIQREINANLQFAIGLNQLWDVLYNHVNELRILSSEINLFGGPLAV
ncbi:hypothetical protein Tco_1397147 [Tanacetum coccineum]